ncbi:MAG: acetyl-CoA carboxylase carboxyltransferase subunit beta [Verrucomicrobia bacterium]|nr:acetyl-CoA carboxylase carboxyltransferase subunit beta [Verrucomicrobiota bacterium]
MAIFPPRFFQGDGAEKRRQIPEGLWTKCPSCEAVVHDLELTQNQRVCPKCGHHFPIGSRARLDHLLDPGSFEEMDAAMESVDILKFTGSASYTERLAANKKKTGLNEAVVSGFGAIEEIKLGIAVMDFAFLGGSMGSVVGEKITRCIETATERGLPAICISQSGGARMYEGMYGLMQMAKASGALALHAKAGLPFISILTHPTTGGVTASFATLGDIQIAEPGAMIGFAGPRVIKETTHQDLPPDFQTAEFLQEHGLIDLIVPRPKMRETLARLLRYTGGKG